MPPSPTPVSSLHPTFIYRGCYCSDVTISCLVPQQYSRQKFRLWPPGRKWLISHGLSTNNDGSRIANQADPLRKTQPCLSWMEGLCHQARVPATPADPRPKSGRSQEALLYPLQGETPSSEERDHNTVGKVAYHMCRKKHFCLGPTKGWVSAFSLYLPLCSV